MTIITTTFAAKQPRHQGEGSPPPNLRVLRCDQCRRLQTDSNDLTLSTTFGPIASNRDRQRRKRVTLPYYLIAALTAAAALSFGTGKSSYLGKVVTVIENPFRHASTRRGDNVRALSPSKAVPRRTEVSRFPEAVASHPHVIGQGASDAMKGGEEEHQRLSFKIPRFLQTMEDSHEGEHDHDDHDIEDVVMESIVTDQNYQQEEEDINLPWGQVIGATFLVSLATLSGLLIVAAGSAYRGILKIRRKINTTASTGANGDRSSDIKDICIFAFAAGALTATAVFLVLPEALHLIEGGHEEEHGHEEEVHRYLEGEDEGVDQENVAAAKFGCAIMGGFLMPKLFGIIFHRPPVIEEGNSVNSEGDAGCPSCIERDATVETGVLVTIERTEMELVDGSVAGDSDVREPIFQPQDKQEHCDICNEDHNAEAVVPIQESVPSIEKIFINKQLCASILLGDSFHNFSDGMFIAASFKASCDMSTSASIVIVTIIHEMAQEMADFILLTRHVGLSVPKALFFNFLSGLSVVLGGIIFLAGNPSDEATGIILGMAGGVYLNISACETLPRIENIIRFQIDRICTLLFFIVGTIPVGLVLLNHRHCG